VQTARAGRAKCTFSPSFGCDALTALSPKVFVIIEDTFQLPDGHGVCRETSSPRLQPGGALPEDMHMTRLTLALAAWMSFVSVVSASLTPRKDPPPFGKEFVRVQAPKLSAEALKLVVEQKATPEFVVTDQTEVLLDGKLCRYEEVPAHASIVRMEVAADKVTVLKIHFRTRK
jgi:hypothetical protein